MYVSSYNQSLNQLDNHQIRVLGTLCEKQLSGSKSYPLTVNDTRLACNQKSGRHPQMALSAEEIREAAKQLAARQLITIDRSGRTERYAHTLGTTLSVDNATLSILTVVMLRGPLSVALIRSATRRLHPFETNREVEQILGTNRVFAVAPRQPGQRGNRYMQAIEPQLPHPVTEQPVAAAAPGNRMVGVRQDLDQLQTLLEPGRKNAWPERR